MPKSSHELMNFAADIGIINFPKLNINKHPSALGTAIDTALCHCADGCPQPRRHV